MTLHTITLAEHIERQGEFSCKPTAEVHTVHSVDTETTCSGSLAYDDYSQVSSISTSFRFTKAMYDHSDRSRTSSGGGGPDHSFSRRGDYSFRGGFSLDDSEEHMNLLDLSDASMVDLDVDHLQPIHLFISPRTSAATNVENILKEGKENMPFGESCNAKDLVHALQETTFGKNVDLLQELAEEQCETLSRNFAMIQEEAQAGFMKLLGKYSESNIILA